MALVNATELELRTFARRKSARSRRRGFLVASIGVAFLGTTSFWLANSGVIAPGISPPLGGPASGAVAEMTAMTANVTRTNGGATLQTGVTLAKVAFASSMTTSLRIDVAWTNAIQGTRVLNNPNAQISVGIYHTIHTGNCVAASNSTDAPLVNLTDTDSNTYCAALDQSATGKWVSSTGKLLLSRIQIGGYLIPSLDGSGALSACASSATDTNTWCQPASVTDPNQRAAFVIASIVTPGGIPQGQQANLSSLTFYLGAQRH
jgi:hypothetical protein